MTEQFGQKYKWARFYSDIILNISQIFIENKI